jgi:hypothetical protein
MSAPIDARWLREFAITFVVGLAVVGLVVAAEFAR